MKRNNIFFLYHPFLFSLVFPAMINFFKRNTSSTHACHQHQYPGLGLGLATREVDRPPNVLESAMLRPNHVNNGLLLPPKVVNGLTCCTESLGFESSDEIDNNIVNDCDEKENRYYDDEIWMRKRNMMKEEERGRVRSYPPPISSLNRNGKPSFYLRPVRKDGRLELTEVRIQRSEILHAWRHDGRLTLHLVPDSEEEEEEEIEEEEEEEIEVEEEEEEEEEWRLRGVGGSEGLRRCHEMVVKQHHHHLRMCGISIV